MCEVIKKKKGSGIAKERVTDRYEVKKSIDEKLEEPESWKPIVGVSEVLTQVSVCRGYRYEIKDSVFLISVNVISLLLKMCICRISRIIIFTCSTILRKTSLNIVS